MFPRIDNYSMLACLMTSRIGDGPARAGRRANIASTADAEQGGQSCGPGQKTAGGARELANGADLRCFVDRFLVRPKIQASSCLPMDELDKCQVTAARPKIGKTIS